MEHVETSKKAEKAYIESEVSEVKQASKEIENPSVEKEVIELENMDLYKFLLLEYRRKIGSTLIQGGFITEEVANKLFNEFSLNAFNQFVKINISI